MATKYPQTAQTGDRGVALVKKICTDAGGIFRSFETSDIGIDAAIEFLTDDREASGDMVLVQIKTGSSYVRNAHFYLDADKDHFDSWARYRRGALGRYLGPPAQES